MPKGNWMYGDNLGKDKPMLDVIGMGIRKFPISTKDPNPPDTTGDPLDWDSPIGEKPWPLRLAIPATLKYIGKIYVAVCTVVSSVFLIVYIIGVLK